MAQKSGSSAVCTHSFSLGRNLVLFINLQELFFESIKDISAFVTWIRDVVHIATGAIYRVVRVARATLEFGGISTLILINAAAGSALFGTCFYKLYVL